MNQYARLEIRFPQSTETFNKLTALFGVQPTDNYSDFPNNIPTVWTYEIANESPTKHLDFINIFLNMIEPKYAGLNKLNIRGNQITFWMLYEYEQQCNIALDPERLKRLGDNGITLCISCWESATRVKQP